MKFKLSKIWVVTVLLAMVLMVSMAPAEIALADVFSCNDVTEIPTAECEVLVAFFNSTNGPSWDDNTGWLDTTTPCTPWFGVTCSSGHIVSLGLPDNSLSGTLPPELGSLPNILYLVLIQNQISGPIPPELGNMTSLQGLNLFHNHLTGPIPPELGNMTSLQRLNLLQNQLSGNIPSELENLSNLEEVNLSSNQLSGSIPPQLGNLPNLEGLALSHNQLSGNIPLELGYLPNLKYLALDNNQLSGSIPPELGDLTNLEILILGSNQLDGSIPSALGDLTNLKSLGLWYNHLSGPVPQELGNLTNLERLQLFNNHLNEAIPPQLGNLSNLETLNLGRNQFSGPIPPELGSLSNLESLGLDKNQLSGIIPSELTSLTSLLATDIGYNMFSAYDPALVTFLNDNDPDWAYTQTVPPEDVQVVSVVGDSVELAWTPILYTVPLHGGYYEVSYATTSGGPYTVHGITADKAASGYTVDGLPGGSPYYYFVVRTFTPAHDLQQNDLWSSYSQEVSVSMGTPHDAIVDLIGEVHELVNAGALNTGQGQALIAKLKVALKQLDKGKTKVAINLLGAFINQVEDFISDGILTPEEGQPLIDTANQIITSLM